MNLNYVYFWFYNDIPLGKRAIERIRNCFVASLFKYNFHFAFIFVFFATLVNRTCARTY